MKNLNEVETNSGLEFFLRSHLTSIDYEALPIKLNMSKRMFTFILRDPQKLTLSQLVTLADIMGKSLDDLKQFIS